MQASTVLPFYPKNTSDGMHVDVVQSHTVHKRIQTCASVCTQDLIIQKVQKHMI